MGKRNDDNVTHLWPDDQETERLLREADELAKELGLPVPPDKDKK